MPANPVETHYTRGDLGEAILAALKAAGKDLDHLTPDDLAPVDEFHGGQRPATIRLAELVGFSGTERVLDVGSGLGGPSRFLAWHYGCRVSGVELTAEFVRVAEMLTRLTGLVGRVDYRQGNALDLPFDDRSFEVVWSQNAAMNIADRDKLYAEMRRVLKPGGGLRFRRSQPARAASRTIRFPGRGNRASAFCCPPKGRGQSSKPRASAWSPGRIRPSPRWSRRGGGRAPQTRPRHSARM